MLKIRVIPTLLVNEFGLIKDVKFNHARRVGSLLPAIKVYNHREVDELILLDISATIQNRPPDFQMIAEAASYCLMPLTVGGGIKDIQHIRTLFQLGVDKVAINSSPFAKPEFITEAANQFGSQSIVISIDAKKTAEGYQCFSHAGRKAEHCDVVSWAKRCETLGAGEILITSIDQDGTMQGYDLALVQLITSQVNIPVIASGGAGTLSHVKDAIVLGQANAIACASLFHFTELTPCQLKEYLAQHGIPVRKIISS